MCRDAGPRLVIKDAVCANGVPHWAADRYTCIESCIGTADDRRKVLETTVQCQVIDYKGWHTLSILCGKIDCQVTDAMFLGEDGIAPTQTIIIEFRLASM